MSVRLWHGGEQLTQPKITLEELRAYAVSGYSLKETAAKLGVTYGSLKIRAQRAKTHSTSQSPDALMLSTRSLSKWAGR